MGGVGVWAAAAVQQAAAAFDFHPMHTLGASNY